jgi:hypothetical protein
MDTSILKTISLESLKRAASIREQISALEAELEAVLTGSARAKGKKKRRGRKKRRAKRAASRAAALASAPAKKKARKKKRKLSPEAIERIREAQRRRWAKVRAGKGK